MRTKSRGNGQGSVYKDGRTWRAEVRIMTGGEVRRIRKRGFATKTEALAYIPRLYEELDKAPLRSVAFSDLWERWTDTETYTSISQDKQKAYKIAYTKCETLYPVSDVRTITFDMLQQTVRGMTYYPARDIKRILNGMFDLAEKMGCLERNLAPLIELPKLQKTEKTIFTEEQLLAIAKSADPFRRYIMVMAYMGLRPIEMLNMTVEDVHFEEGYTDGGRKTELSAQICIFPEAVPYLRDLCEEVKAGRLCPMSEDHFYTQFYKCLDSAGVQKNNLHELTPYSCRHTFVTRLTKKGMPTALIQKAARHTSYKTTQGYTHIDFSDLTGWGQ